MMMDKKKYKDQCESCGKFAILKSFNGKCFCENCIKDEVKINNSKKNQCSNIILVRKEQISIYDMGE